METYLSALLSGTADPFWPHFALLALSVLAGIAVGAGIILESPEYPASIHRKAKWLVIGGVAIESICTISLFAFDEGISGAQQAKILALERRLAPRTLSEEQQASIVNAIKRFAPQQFSGLVGAVDPEAWRLWTRLDGTLRTANWIRSPVSDGSSRGDPPAVLTVTPDQGVRIFVPINDLAELKEASLALEAALRAADISALAVTDTSVLARQRIIMIEVGPKPQ
jgi:hypothetical protein